MCISSNMNRSFRTSLASRERNRVHAQRTRQRKKEQMQGLQGRVDVLKDEQIRLRQVINEKNTANILVGLFAQNTSVDVFANIEDPHVDELLKRSVDDIPDTSKIPELPALILPGQHASKSRRAASPSESEQDMLGIDGIDLELLGRDRSQCTPQELDKIRRERNRMHAKRTRDRKRMFTDKLSEMSRILQEENDVLKEYISKIDPTYSFETEDTFGGSCTVVTNEISSSCSTPGDESPKLPSGTFGEQEMSDISLCSSFVHPRNMAKHDSTENSSASEHSANQYDSISTLLKVAGCFEKMPLKRSFPENDSSDILHFHDSNENERSEYEISPAKRSCVSNDIPYSITTGGV